MFAPPEFRRPFGVLQQESSSDLDDVPPVKHSNGLPSRQSGGSSSERLAAVASSATSAWQPASGVEKHGAGLLFVNAERNEVLLLLRNSLNNNNTWGLPGGNRDPGDGSSIDTAMREGTEELKFLPPFTVRGMATVVRGKRGQKHYDVHVCDITPSAVSLYTPALNHEHSDWKWIPIDEVVLSARGGKKGAEMAKKWPLHPVVEKFFADHWGRLAKRESATAFAR